MQICTLITKNRLAWARVLVRSLLKHHPGLGVTVLCIDEVEDRFDPADEPFDLITVNDLEVADLWGMALRYTAFEFSMALKPWLIRHVLDNHGTAIYLDSDIRIYGALDPLFEALGRNEVVLVPHLARPLPHDGVAPEDDAILVGGAHNAGCVGMAAGATTDALLRWWSTWLRTHCRQDPSRGLMVDQRWLDLAPGLFEGIHLLRDPGINVAYWNLPGRALIRDAADNWRVDDAPLRFFHFSGFDPAQPRRLSMYDARYRGSEMPDYLAELCAGYAAELSTAGLEESADWPYSWATTASGIPLRPWLRRVLDPDRGDPGVTPFSAVDEPVFLRWWNGPGERGAKWGLTRFHESLHADRDDLRGAFVDLAGNDGYRFRQWTFEHGRDDIPAELLPLAPSKEDSAQRTRLAPGVHDVKPGQAMGLERDQMVVAIPVYGARDLFVRCLSSVLRHTSRDVPILVADDASPDSGIRAFVDELESAGTLEHHIGYLLQPENVGFVANVNAVFTATAPADVVVLNSDCVVGEGWLSEMRGSAYSDTNVATSTALTNHGTILSVPYRNRPVSDLPQSLEFERAAAEVRRGSLRCYPRIPTAIGHCMYIRRDALDLVGGFDLAFSPGYGEEVDFSQRCILQGLVHVGADATLVLHRQGGTFGAGAEASPVQREHERQLAQRYPYYDRMQDAASRTAFGPLPRALSAARRSLSGISVTVDARILGPVLTGTQVHVVELIGALDRTGEIAVRAIVPPDLGRYARDAFADLQRVELMPHTEVHSGMDRTDVVHRPFQVSSDDDLDILRWCGDRCVITHQDLIAYRNPGYFPAFPQWERYQRLTRRALAIADAVVFFSEHVARDALLEEIVDGQRAHVVHIGVDHVLLGERPDPRPPDSANALDGRDFLLCLGTDFRHKNRVFALRLLEALQARHGWGGQLVLAGPRVEYGSSAGDEAAFLATRPEVAKAVVSLPAIGEPEKEWLYAHAAGCIYPTLYEGFGLVPFEAAERGVPSFFASTTSLQEILPRDIAQLVPWDAAASADRVARTMRNLADARMLVDRVLEQGAQFSWDKTADMMLGVYRRATAAPARESAYLAWDALDLERQRVDLERKYNDLWTVLSEGAHELLGPKSPLTPELQRSLSAVLRRPALRASLVGALRLGHIARQTLRRQQPSRPAPVGDDEARAFRLHFETSNRMHIEEQRRKSPTEELIPEP